MKKIFVTLLTALVCFSSFAQTEWVKQDIDKNFSVGFPVKPEQEEMMGVSLFKHIDSDSVSYVVTFTDLGAFGMDSATIAEQAPTQEFHEMLKGQFESQIPGVTFTKNEIVPWGNYTTYIFEAEDAEKKNKLYMKAVFVGEVLYVLTSGVPSKAAATKTADKDKFFNSIAVK